jgi:hypothetical protein
MSDEAQRVRKWLGEGKRRRSTHVIIAYNQRDKDFRPVYVSSSQNVRTKLSDLNNDYALKPVEVYNLSMDTEKQLLQARTWNV